MRYIDDIIAYESGELNDKKTLELFSKLVKSGAIWSLQGHYSRTGSALIQDNWLDNKGNINKEKYNTLL